jgi:hypothetical protein
VKLRWEVRGGRREKGECGLSGRGGKRGGEGLVGGVGGWNKLVMKYGEKENGRSRLEKGERVKKKKV